MSRRFGCSVRIPPGLEDESRCAFPNPAKAGTPLATLAPAMATAVTPVPARSASRHEHQRRGPAVGRVLVLNATFEPINVCTLRRAVFARDNWTCQYCGSRANLTVDHVVPRSKGGPSSWENIVASCAPCNRRKGNALPRQVGMRLLRQPRTPSPHVFIQVAAPSIPAAWRAYLAA